MKENGKKGVLKKVVNAVNSLSTTAAKNKVVRGQAKILNAQAKSIRTNAKANLINARQGIAKTRARATAVAASIGGVASSKAASSQAAAGLNAWNQIIQGTPEPAEGTGKPETGAHGGTPDLDMNGQPVGNF